MAQKSVTLVGMKGLVANANGEFVEFDKIVATSGVKARFTDEYVCLFLGGLKRLALLTRDPAPDDPIQIKLKAESIGVLFYCLAHIGTNNEIEIPKQTQIAEALGMKPPAVSRAINDLCAVKIFYKLPNSKLKVNADFVWRGAVRDHKQGMVEAGKAIKAGEKEPAQIRRVQSALKRAQRSSGASVPSTIPESSLIWGSWIGNTKKLESMLKDEQPLEERDPTGMTPLMVAAAWGNPEEVRIMLQHGADPACRDVEGDNALHYCALHSRNSDTAELLLAAGIPIDTTNWRGQTPLHLASCVSDSATIKPEFAVTLLKHHADPVAVDDDDKTPRDYAESASYAGPEVDQLLGMLSA